LRDTLKFKGILK